MAKTLIYGRFMQIIDIMERMELKRLEKLLDGLSQVKSSLELLQNLLVKF